MQKMVSTSENIKVAVRIRPFLSNENPMLAAWEVTSNTSIKSKKGDKQFSFDRLYGMNSTTQRIFDEIGEQVIWKAMDGYSGCIICYGQTTSGKTFTMCGNKQSNPGIIPLSIHNIFGYIEETPEREYLLRCSYVEIYNECINDLLNPSNVNLQVLEDRNRGTVIVNVTEEVCKTSDQVYSFLKIGDGHKRIASTNFNDKSSRSHCWFKIIIESKDRTEEDLLMGTVSLIDLAGSESVSSTENERVKEAKFINRSLLALGTVILRLSDTKNKTPIPYRESKLTRLLRPILQGEAKLVLITTSSPSSTAYDESLNSLKFAERARCISQVLIRTTLNEENSLLLKYLADISKLRENLQQFEITLIEDYKSKINKLSTSEIDDIEEQKERLQSKLEIMQSAILVAEQLRDMKMMSLQSNEDLLVDFQSQERSSTRLKLWRQSQNSTSVIDESHVSIANVQNSIEEEEVEEEDSLPQKMVPFSQAFDCESPKVNFCSPDLRSTLGDWRMSIPQEPCVNSLISFRSKPHFPIFCKGLEIPLQIGRSLLTSEEIPLPHSEWLKIMLEQDSIITELNAQLAMKDEENKVLIEELRLCKESLERLQNNLKC
ncbi:unnamed protein product [Blepharisma stoltei]|uniref:Kinesin-like protein n=1 Tax=Blepharisma stoltei TaxID=1481888 RepID=A0AAU9K2Z6_9CILI|nr:unnamed protein product [Blepharisma stoltei]